MNINKKFLILIIIFVVLTIIYNLYQQYTKTTKENFETEKNEIYKINRINTEINIDDKLTVKDKYLRIATIKKPYVDDSGVSPIKKLFISLYPLSSLVSVFNNFEISIDSDGKINSIISPEILRNTSEEKNGNYINNEKIWANEIEKENIDLGIPDKYYEIFIKFEKEVKNLKVVYKQDNLEIKDLLLHGNVSNEDLTSTEPAYEKVLNTVIFPSSSTLEKNSFKLSLNALNSYTSPNLFDNITNTSDMKQVVPAVLKNIHQGINKRLTQEKLGTNINFKSLNLGSFQINSENGSLNISNNSKTTKLEINKNNIVMTLGNTNHIGLRNNWSIKTNKSQINFMKGDKNALVIYLNKGKLGLSTRSKNLLLNHNGDLFNYWKKPSMDSHRYLGNSNKIINAPWYKDNKAHFYSVNRNIEVVPNFFEGNGGYKNNSPIFAYSRDKIPLTFIGTNISKPTSNNQVDQRLRGYFFNIENFENSSIYNMKSNANILNVNEITLDIGDKISICDFSNIKNNLLIKISIVSLPDNDKKPVLQEIKIIYDKNNASIDLSPNKVNDSNGIKTVYYKDKKIYADVNILNKYLFFITSTENISSIVNKLDVISSDSITIKPNESRYVFNNMPDKLNLDEDIYKKNLIDTLNALNKQSDTFISKFNDKNISIDKTITLKEPVTILNNFKVGEHNFVILNGNLGIGSNNESSSMTLSRNLISFNTNKLVINSNDNDIPAKTIEIEKNLNKNVLKFSAFNQDYLFRISEKGGSKMSRKSLGRGVYYPFSLNRDLGKNIIEGFQENTEEELTQNNNSTLKSKILSKTILENGEYILAKIKIPQVNKTKCVKFIVDNNDSYLLINNNNFRFISFIKNNNLSAYKDGNIIIVFIKTISNTKINYETINIDNDDFIESQISNTNNEKIKEENDIINTIYYKNETTENSSLRGKIVNNYINLIKNNNFKELAESNKIIFEGGIILTDGGNKYKISVKDKELVISYLENNNNSENKLLSINDNGNFNILTQNGFSLKNNFYFRSLLNSYGIYNSKNEYLILAQFNGNTFFGTPRHSDHIDGLYFWNKIEQK